MVFQQREGEAVLVRAATCALIQGLGLHQRAVGVVEDDKTLGAGGELGKHDMQLYHQSATFDSFFSKLPASIVTLNSNNKLLLTSKFSYFS